ncbi:MAG: hypothetical protein LBV01_06270 [Deltaproteobacteria bacterium]|jgi:YbbR domain-containing protein|nr:hypothetical protein [Deltaproteobacteria bacterium]
MSIPSFESEKWKQAAGKYLAEAVASLRDIRILYAFIAFCLAVTLWYTVTVRDKVESWVDVQVVFKGAPDALIISDGLINKLSVRVRAARGLSRGLTGRDATVVVDLSAITRGSNAIPVAKHMLPFNSAYEVMEVSPSRIVIVADLRSTKDVALESAFEGKLAPDFFVKSLRVNPPNAVISGPEGLLSGIPGIRLPIRLTPDILPGRFSTSVAVPIPINVSVNPSQASVELEIGVRTRQVTLTCPVTLAAPAAPAASGEDKALRLSPDKVTVVADIPESLAKDAKKLAALVTATVSRPSDLSVEAGKAQVTVNLPANAQLISVTPPAVKVSGPAQP